LLCSVATDGTPLQQVVMRCNQSGCGVAARATGAVSMSSALRLNSRQQVAPGLWSVAAGCGQLQHGTALQQIALACITVVVRFSQQVRLRHSKLHCVATGFNMSHRCNALQQVERRPVLQQNRTLLQHAPLQQTALSCSSPALSH
jgi:hypothetical protein